MFGKFFSEVSFQHFIKFCLITDEFYILILKAVPKCLDVLKVYTCRVTVNEKFNIKVDYCFICREEHEFSFGWVKGKFVDLKVMSNIRKFHVNSTYYSLNVIFGIK
jgi:hypothetical protein